MVIIETKSKQVVFSFSNGAVVQSQQPKAQPKAQPKPQTTTPAQPQPTPAQPQPQPTTQAPTVEQQISAAKSFLEKNTNAQGYYIGMVNNSLKGQGEVYSTDEFSDDTWLAIYAHLKTNKRI